MTSPHQPAVEPIEVAPTDLELMAYFDGELDGERALEVARYLEATESARQKLDGLSVLGSWVRAQHAEPGHERLTGGPELAAASLGEGFTDALMARIEAESAGEGERSADPPRAQRPPRVEVPSASVPANDNGRLLWGLVAAAAAAAAGLFLWGKGLSGLDESQVARVIGAPALSTSSATVAASSSSAAAVAEADDDSTGVEIAAVDFGAATGAIYYVPKGDDLVGAATTTVVWLADE